MCFNDVLNETPTYQISVSVSCTVGSWHWVLENTLSQLIVYWYSVGLDMASSF